MIEAIKKAAGDDFPVGIRLCLHEYTPWGYGLDYGLQIAAHLEATGCVDYFNSDAGSFSSFWMEIPPMAVAQGSFRELNRALKRASCLPVIAFGRIKTYELASEILAAGEADYVGFCRQLITDPETPNKMREGRLDEIRYCIACNDACVYQVNQDKPIRCIHNPDAGNESAFTIRTMPKADPAKRVVVVGGGLAGLKVAETAARRGHDVVLFERSHELGGQVLLAARQPYHAEIRDVTRHLELEVARLGVDLRLDTEADPDLVRDQQPDVLVVATGSEPNLPPRRGKAMDIPGIAAELGRHVPVNLAGIDSDNVFSADEILAGDLPLGQRVLVVDGNGHWEAAGTIEYLLEAGFEVEVVTQAAATRNQHRRRQPRPFPAEDREARFETLSLQPPSRLRKRPRPGGQRADGRNKGPRGGCGRSRDRPALPRGPLPQTRGRPVVHASFPGWSGSATASRRALCKASSPKRMR